MRRKSLLYESKVEYGGWTINHVQGCGHGCRYPCYAMMLAKRTGRVKSYEEWRRPHVVENALELLEAKLPRLTARIDSVHLCFTTDPFMYDAEVGGPVAEIVDLTTRIIERLNEWGIRVTTLSKGVYPEDFVERTRSLSPRNQYGLSLVSLSEAFRSQWEPGSAPLAARIAWRVASWCVAHGKTLHIKKGTSLSDRYDRYVADVLGANHIENDRRVLEALPLRVSRLAGRQAS